MKLFKSKTQISPTGIDGIVETSWKKISRDPFVDWIFMLLVGFAVMVAMIVIGVFTYISAGAATSFVSDQTTPIQHVTIDVRGLKSVANHIDNNMSTSTAVNFVVPGDPSL